MQTVNGGTGTLITTPLFVKNGFNAQCSANTIVSFDEVNTNAIAVASGSKKGNQTFAGSSAGGAIGVNASCPVAGCSGAEVTTAHDAAVLAAGS